MNEEVPEKATGVVDPAKGGGTKKDRKRKKTEATKSSKRARGVDGRKVRFEEGVRKDVDGGRQNPNKADAVVNPDPGLEEMNSVPEPAEWGVDVDGRIESVSQSRIDLFLAAVKSWKKPVISLTENRTVSREYFKSIYGSGKAYTRDVVDLVMATIWLRNTESLTKRKVFIADSSLAPLLAKHYDEFLRQRSAKEDLVWPTYITDYVQGVLEDRPASMVWCKEAHRIYAPIDLGDNHWVGLHIKIKDWEVEVFDPCKHLFHLRKLKKALEPITMMLPYILKGVTGWNDQLSEIKVNRLRQVTNVLEDGESGPIACKLIELHCDGEGDLHGIDGKYADMIRMSYAIAIYESFVKPLPSD